MSLIFRNRVLFFVNVSGFEKRVFFEEGLFSGAPSQRFLKKKGGGGVPL